MKIDANFNEYQTELLKKENIDISQDFDEDSLEDLEEKVYNLMMDNLDKNQDFTPKAQELEKILDVIVKIENSL